MTGARVILVAVVAASVAIAIAALTNGEGGSGPVAARSASSAASTTPASPALTAEQAAALAYIREEEKLARDVYLVLAGTSGDRRFTMIGRSEQQHFDLAGGLLAAHGVPDPALGRRRGSFTDPVLQDAYDDFVRRGSASPQEALAVGREIERMDLADLATRRAELPQPDVLRVIDRLAAASQRHLTAFSR